MISRWLIATRAAVLIMTFLSAAIAGILAAREGAFDLLKWLLVVLGLCLAHATNNLLNDYIDYVKGVDQDNYYRAQYGPQPLVHGLMSKAELLRYAAVTGLLAIAAGVVLIVQRGGLTWLLMALGRVLCALLHLAAQVHRPRRDRRVDRLGTAHDRRRLLCHYRRLGLADRPRQPALCSGSDRGDLWQAH